MFFIVIINKCTALYFHQMNEKQISLKTKHWRQKSHKIYQVFHILEQCNVVSSFEFFFTKNRLDSRAYVVLIRRVRNVQLSNHRIFWTKILLLSSGLIYIFFSTKSRWPIHSFIRSLDENNTHVIIPLKFIRWFSARKILCFMRNLHMYFFFLAKCACRKLAKRIGTKVKTVQNKRRMFPSLFFFVLVFNFLNFILPFNFKKNTI